VLFKELPSVIIFSRSREYFTRDSFHPKNLEIIDSPFVTLTVGAFAYCRPDVAHYWTKKKRNYLIFK
jgi:hypothetical protein